MKLTLTFDKGLNADALPSELGDGMWSAASNARPRNGMAERIGGTSSTYLTFSHTPIWLATIKHSTPTQGFYLVAGSQTRLFATDYSTSTEITRYTQGATVSTATAVGTTVTITTSGNHGRTTGDVISTWGFTESAYNVNGKAITVTGLTTFTYVADSAPAGAATVIGLYSYNGATQNFSTMSGRRWTGGEMGGVLFMNHLSDGLFYWAGDTSIRARRVPRSYTARASRPFGNYIVQLAPLMSAIQYPYRILWSTATEPGSIPSAFDAAATNDAGLVDKTEGGECVDGLQLGDDFIIYKQSGRIRMRYIGGTDVFAFDTLVGTEGLLAANCVVDTPVGHVFLSSNYQVLLHAGGECRNISDGRVNSLITQSSSTNYFVTKNPAKNEVWVYIVNGSTYPTRALVWNWVDDKWGVREYGSQQIPFALSYFWESDRSEYLSVINSSGALATEDRGGATIFGDSFDTYVERIGINAGESDVLKNLQRSRWNFDAANGVTATIEHGSAMTAAATPTYQSGVTYTVGTSDYVNARATAGRFMGIKATWTGTAGVRTAELDFTTGGRR